MSIRANRSATVEDFPTLGRETWLNHAAIAPWPRVVIEAMQHFIADNARHGPRSYRNWLTIEAQLRQRLATLLGGLDPEDIAITENTSAGLNLIATGLDWRSRDRIVIPAGEFPSNRLPWFALAERGIEVVEVDLPSENPESALIDAIDPCTRLMSVSAVRYDTGVRLDLEKLGSACQKNNVLLCVDAIQQVGALPIDPQSCGVDFLAAGAHKWLMCPEGIGFFWSSAQARVQLRQTRHGWRMCSQPFDFDKSDWQPQPSARRFEIGTLNTAGIHALHAATGLMLEYGPETIAESLLERTGHLYQALQAIEGVEISTPADSGRRAGIISFCHSRHSPKTLFRALADQGIHAAVRGTQLRLSPHFYTPVEALDATVEVIAQMP